MIDLGMRWSSEQEGFDDLAALAVRDNPKRVQLVVSKVLGKHIPAPPAEIIKYGHELGERVRSLLDTDTVLVIGYCETATSLGHLVAECFDDSYYVHTTRRPSSALPIALEISERHSHATQHFLQPLAEVLASEDPVVLVDDEITTGSTALNTIRALHAIHRRRRYVVACLIDSRSPDSAAAFAECSAELGVEVSVLSLLAGQLEVADIARRLVEQWPLDTSAALSVTTPAVTRTPFDWPAAVPLGGMHGFPAALRKPFDAALAGLVSVVDAKLIGSDILVLGTEELMYLPLRLAAGLRGNVVFQSTTRSPALTLDVEGYPLRRRISFTVPTDSSRRGFLYNIAHYSDIVVCVDDHDACVDELVEALRPWASKAIHVITIAPSP